jgi:hypothetical protein
MVLEFVAWLIMELLLYNIGRAVIAVVSLGRARAENLKEAFRTGAPPIGDARTPVVVPALATQFIGGVALSLALMLLVTFGK